MDRYTGRIGTRSYRNSATPRDSYIPRCSFPPHALNIQEQILPLDVYCNIQSFATIASKNGGGLDRGKASVNEALLLLSEYLGDNDILQSNFYGICFYLNKIRNSKNTTLATLDPGSRSQEERHLFGHLSVKYRSMQHITPHSEYVSTSTPTSPPWGSSPLTRFGFFQSIHEKTTIPINSTTPLPGLNCIASLGVDVALGEVVVPFALKSLQIFACRP
jgi:hypothetical protein